VSELQTVKSEAWTRKESKILGSLS